MGRHWSKLLVAVMYLTLSVTFAADVFAKGGSSSGGGRSFSGGARISSRSVSAPPKSSMATMSPSKPSTTPGSTSKVGFFGNSTNKPTTSTWAASTPKPKSGVGVANAYTTKVPPTAQVKQGFMGTSVFDKSAAVQMKQQRASAAKAQLATNNAKFKQSVSGPTIAPNVSSNPKLSNVKVSSGGYNTWSNDRNRYYRDRNWNTPTYIYVGQPSYGLFDAMFMWSMLDSIENREQMELLRSIQNDPATKKWREDATKAAETDPAVLKKLNEMDAKLATLTGDIDPNYKPTNIPASVMYSNEVLEALPKDKFIVNIGTGSLNGTYHVYQQLLEREGKEMFIYKESPEPNLAVKVSDFVQGRLDMFSGPVDGINIVAAFQPIDFKNVVHSTIPMYREIMVMVANKTGPTNMTQLDDSSIIIPNIKNSGTDLTWKNICQNDTTGRYKSVKVVNMSMTNPLDPKDGVFKVLSENKNAVIFYQGGINSEFMKNLEAAATERGFRLMMMNDEDVMGNILDDTQEDVLYKQVNIPSEKFPKLSEGTFVDHDTTAYTVDSVLVVSKSWVDKNGPDAYDELVADSVAIQSYVEKHVNGYEN